MIMQKCKTLTGIFQHCQEMAFLQSYAVTNTEKGKNQKGDGKIPSATITPWRSGGARDTVLWAKGNSAVHDVHMPRQPQVL